MTDDRQRIDKWLWFARVVKTRDLAKSLAESGHVRLNGRRVDAASQAVKTGDILTIGIHGGVRILKVAGFAERRQAAPLASLTYEDLSPKPDPADIDTTPAAATPEVHHGEGRPTKRDRRRYERDMSDF